MICVHCGRDINAIWQDNVSTVPGRPMCEDCANGRCMKNDDEPTTEDERCAVIESRRMEQEMDWEEWKASQKR